jgi:hypothetical protein
LFPYYTHNFLNELKNWDVKDWNVFEYGGGHSTLWWRKKSKSCVSVDTSKLWSKNMNLIYEPNKENFIMKPQIICEHNNEKFDCIIIDGEPVEWRDDCTEIAIKSLKRNGILIIDNWLQNSIEHLKENDWTKSKSLLSKYESKVYKQEDHSDWKTAFWVIKD